MAELSNVPLHKQLEQQLYSRKGKPKLKQNQRKGSLKIVKKEYPAMHAAAMATLGRMKQSSLSD